MTTEHTDEDASVTAVYGNMLDVTIDPGAETVRLVIEGLDEVVLAPGDSLARAGQLRVAAPAVPGGAPDAEAF